MHSKDDYEKLSKIADRAVEFPAAKDAGLKVVDFLLPLTACHRTSPLDLDRLLEADDFNFVHDVFGIYRHIDRSTGELTNCFLPRATKAVEV